MLMDLQYFAEQEENETNENEQKEENGKTGLQKIELTQEELDAKINSEYDRRLAKRQTDFDKQLADALEKGKSEGQKLAKMSATEKAEAEQKTKEDALAQRESELNKRELSANVKDILNEKGLPASLSDSLVALGDADKISDTIGVLSKSIEDEVNKRVKESLRTGPPKNNSSVLDDDNDPFKAVMETYKKK